MMERTNIIKRDSRISKNDNTSSQSNNTLFERVLRENTELARTLAIREKSSTSTMATPPTRFQKQEEEKTDVVMRVGGSVARARMVNNNLDWLCTKCRNHNFARVVVRCRSSSTQKHSRLHEYNTGMQKMWSDSGSRCRVHYRSTESQKKI